MEVLDLHRVTDKVVGGEPGRIRIVAHKADMVLQDAAVEEAAAENALCLPFRLALNLNWRRRLDRSDPVGVRLPYTGVLDSELERTE